MSGYIGKGKSVVNVASYTKAQADAEFVNDPNSVITVSSGNVGIGTSSPDTLLNVQSSTAPTIRVGDGTRHLEIRGGSTTQTVAIGTYYAGALTFATNSTERMRIDSSGRLLLGKTAVDNTTVGFRFDGSTGFSSFVRDGGEPLYLNRKTSDGNILKFAKDGSTVGSIGSISGDTYLNTGSTGLRFFDAFSQIIPCGDNGSSIDNAIDLGRISVRFDDVYATNGTIQTSDRNEKQDIEALSDAEQRVAVACKGLLRKFRWIDSVAEKGDAARIHFGIIAQDLQDAFTAEGLDAGRYAMFISTTWWETQTEVPAVEADEENGIETKEAYTRTDTYETLEEAPEGATERTRLGVRYPELLAFIIGAM